MLSFGTLIEDKYEILTQIGEGGMSYVYLARDQRLNKQWAIKEIKQSGNRALDEMSARAFVSEANMMKRVDHPMLPRIVDIISYEGSILVVMDYIEGQSLSKILDEVGPQAQEDVVEWGLELCDGLNYLHSQTPPIIYRDMKPANIMLKPDGTVRIIDFGTAREYRFEEGQQAGDTTMLGTRGYAAPEQFSGDGQTDARTDIYCLGATLYHLLTGKSPAEPPYEMVPIRQVVPSLSPGLEKVVAKCIQPNPDMRYQSIAELYYALVNYEREDDAHFKQLRRRIAAFVAPSALSGLLLLGGIGTWATNTVLINREVERLLMRVRVSSDHAETEQYLLRAIDLKPSELSSYSQLIELYKQDNVFSEEEEAVLQMLVTKHLSYMHNGSPESAYLSFQIGTLYLYYYEFGDTAFNSNVMRATYARNWFEYAKGIDGFALQADAELYYRVCDDIYTVFDLEKRSGISDDRYRAFYVDMQQLLAKSEGQNDVMRIWVSSTVLSVLNECKYSFETAGISVAQQHDLFKEAQKMLAGSNPPTDMHQTIKENADKTIGYLTVYFESRGIMDVD